MDRRSEFSLRLLSPRLIGWLGSLCALVFGLQLEFVRLEQRFDTVLQQAVHQIEGKVNRFEVALEGFANFLAVAGDIGDDAIRAYVQSIRKLYPDLYMFEIASRVEHRQREAFEQSMRAQGYPGFVIHGFDYEGGRQVTTVGGRPEYYPIRFIEPASLATREVLGLDLGSTSASLVEAMMDSLQAPRPRVSRPFQLLEGSQGYVMYRPVLPQTHEQTAAAGFHEYDFALLVIKGQDLLPTWLQAQQGYSVTLAFIEAGVAEESQLLVAPDNRGQGADGGVHTYRRTVQIDNPSQPFELTLQQTIFWRDLNLLSLLLVIGGGTLLSLYTAYRLARYQHRKQHAREEREQLYRLANFDALTGLPNINLLVDLAEQAISIAQRSEGLVAVFYLDVDKFKSVNDTWGHDAGDELLIEVATRLTQVIRAEDTVARIHGDEFIVLLPEISDRQAIAIVTNKLLSIFAQPFAISGEQLCMRGSIGAATFPADGRDLESLLSVSDQRMYEYKQADPTLFLVDPELPETETSAAAEVKEEPA